MDVQRVDGTMEERLAHRFAAAFLVTAATARRELGHKRRHLDLRELANGRVVSCVEGGDAVA